MLMLYHVRSEPAIFGFNSKIPVQVSRRQRLIKLRENCKDKTMRNPRGSTGAVTTRKITQICR